MKFRIPYTLANLESLKRKSSLFNIFKGSANTGKKSSLQGYLDNANIKLTPQEYLSICLRTFIFTFIIMDILAATFLVIVKNSHPFLISAGVAFLFSAFAFFSQVNYPRLYQSRRIKNIEKNLVSSLQDMLVQLNSGIPIFNILVNISSSDYGELSEEFKKAVRKINAGLPQVEVLEQLGEGNSSIFFKRTLWQLSNGMRAGSDISIVIQESIKTLNEEQVIQIQNYGNKLNPLIMFYMLISVIMPALSLTFLIIIASMLGLEGSLINLLFIGIFVAVVIMQVMFLGMIKSIRPSLI
ncbi:MAG: type II secretion system F family protein [Nanoarchaeota archaeon]|nr:type II secretion system F family protein [Nanoarchaeota archaeon]